MDPNLRFRSWLVLLKKFRGVDHLPDELAQELEQLIQDLEKLLEVRPPTGRRISSQGKRVANVVVHVLMRFGEHELVAKALELGKETFSNF